MKKILTIGTATRDVFLSSPLFRVVHDPAHLEKLGFPTGEAQCFALGGKLEVEKPILTTGGGAANASITFSRQGYTTELIAKIGDDDNGLAILNDLKKDRVSYRPIKDKKQGTAYSVILISPGGERTILHFRGASEDLRVSDLNSNSLRADVAYVVPGRIAFSVMTAILKTLKKNGVFVAMNPSKHYLDFGAKKLKPILDSLDVIILNREEGAELTGEKYEDEVGIFKKFDKLVQGIAVMTDGPKGVTVSDGENLYKAGIFKEQKIVDRTGAGDAFGSGFVGGLIKKSKIKNQKFSSGGKIIGFSRSEIEYAIRLGSANATSVVEAMGAEPGILTKKQFETNKRWKNLVVQTKKI
jgi:sugar/nucleoside kinase (ribokinase family)